MSEYFGTLSLNASAYVDFNISENNTGQALENTEIFDVRLGRIKAVKVINFKSFENEHYVGPFTRFTSVIGPNGGGKSNVLDAIQFVLGMSARSMRCNKADELIYSPSMYYQNVQYEEREASVEIIFEAQNYIEEQISLKRTLNNQLEAQFYIADKKFPEKEFVHFLVLSKIILPAKNFIMLQGDTDSLATIDPKKLTELFEYTSGSVQYKNICLSIQDELSKIVTRLRELQFQKAGMRNEQRKVRELKNTSDKFRKLNDEITELKLKQRLFQLKKVDDEIEDMQDSLQKANNKESNYIEENKKLIQEMQDCENEMEKLKMELNQISANQLKIKKDEKSKVYDTTQMDLEIELLVKQKATLEMQLQRVSKDASYYQEMLGEIELDISGKQEYVDKLQKQNKIKLPQKVMEEFTLLQNKFKIQNEQIQSDITKLQEKQSISQQIYDQIDDEIKQYQEDKQELVQAQEEQQIALKHLNNELDMLKDTYLNTLKRVEDLHRQNQIEENEQRELQQHKIECERQLKFLELQETENIDEKQTQILIQQLKTMFPDFIGELSSLCNPEQQQFAIALKVALGQRLLCALVVESEQSAKGINLHLKGLDIVKELIVLKRVKPPKNEGPLKENVEQFISQYRQQYRAGRAYLAIDVIKCDSNLKDVLKQLLFGIVICDSYQLAVALQKEQIQEVKQIITLDGITLASSGLIIFNGSTARLADMRNFRSNNQRIQQKGQKETKDNLIKKIADIANKMKAMKNVGVLDDLKKQSALKMKLEEQQVILQNKEVQLKKLSASYDEKIKAVDKQLHDLQIEINKRANQLAQYETELTELTDQLKNLQKSAYQDFAKKTGISLDDLNHLDQQSNINKQLEIKIQQINKLISQKAGMEKQIQDIKDKETDLKNKIQTKIENVKTYEDRKIEIKKNHEQKDSSLVQINEQQTEINKKLKNLQKQLNSLQDKRNQQIRQGVDYKQGINMTMRKLEQLKYQRGRIIEQCEMEQIPVRFKKSQGTVQPSLNFDDENQVILEQIDYAPIEKELKDKQQNRVLETINTQLELKEQEITKYLSENLQVGLVKTKTDEKFIQIETKIEELAKQIKELQNKETELGEEFVKMRQRRKELFEDLFDRVDKELNILYPKLTENQDKVGGTVLLYMENKEEPFEGGLIYTPNPPNKKYIFDNSEQLSGGEKTMASLALMLAINSSIDAPFMLLDEVDAHLDQENAEKLRKIVKLLSDQMQFILVSHNPDVFAFSDSLVGVTIQHSKTTSEAFSLLL